MRLSPVTEKQMCMRECIFLNKLLIFNGTWCNMCNIYIINMYYIVRSFRQLLQFDVGSLVKVLLEVWSCR